MGAVGLAFRAEVRRRWRSWVVVALLVSLVGGVVLGLVAAGRRTETAYPRFLTAAHASDALVYSATGFGLPPAAVARLPEVGRSATVAFPVAILTTDRRQLPPSWNVAGSTDPAMGRSLDARKYVSGRAPDPSQAGEAAVAFNAGGGVALGSVVHLHVYAPTQGGVLFQSFGPVPVPTGPTVTVHVVGVEASPDDFPSGAASPTLFITPALFRQVQNEAAVPYADAVQLRPGASLPAFETALQHLPGGLDLYVQNDVEARAPVQRSIHFQAVAWWILAAIVAVAGLAVVGQILARQAAVDAADYPTLRAVGMSDHQLLLLGALRMTVVAAAGAIGAVAVAYAVSPLTPIGEAAVAEPSPGPSFDTVVLVLGAVAVLVVAAVVGTLPAALQARRGPVSDHEGRLGPARPSVVAAWLGRAGAPVSTVVGARLAFERGRGRAAVPTVTAFLGATLAVVALVGTSVYSASLDHLLASPRLYGATYDMLIENPDGSITSILPALERYRGIAQISGGTETSVRIRGVAIDTFAERSYEGPVLAPPNIVGHPPRGPRQIVLGETTLRQVGGHVGGDVPVTIGKVTAPYTVVGTAVFPVFGAAGGLGTGATMTLSAYQSAACAGHLAAADCIPDGAVIALKPGPGRDATLARLENAFGNGAELRVKPTTLVNFGQVANLPLVLGLAVALFGAATLLHFLLVSAARRRREVGTLKTLGLLLRQVSSVVLWQATAVMVVGLVLGVPLGIAAGHLAWNVTASNVGVVPDTVVPAWGVVAVVVGALVVVNVVAIGPAVMSRRLAPAVLLRSE